MDNKVDRRKTPFNNLLFLREEIQKEIVRYEEQGKKISDWGQGQKEAYQKISGALYHIINQMIGTKEPAPK